MQKVCMEKTKTNKKKKAKGAIDKPYSGIGIQGTEVRNCSILRISH